MVERVPSGQPGFRSLTGLVTALAVLFPSAPTSSRAEALITGTIEAVQIEARNSSIEEVLGGLRASFGLQYRSSIHLDRPLEGSFKGTVLGIIAVLLKNYDHVVKRSGPDLIEVTVIRLREPDGNPRRASPQAAPAPARGPDRLMTPAAGPHPHPPPSNQFPSQPPHPPRP